MTSLSIHDGRRRISLFVIFKYFFLFPRIENGTDLQAYSKWPTRVFKINNILGDGALIFALYFWFMSVPLIHEKTKYSTSNLIWSFAFVAVYSSIKKYF